MTPSSESLALIKWSKPGIIYVARNRVNGMLYIGQTICELRERKSGHLRDALNGADRVFQRSIRKYGPENFEWFILQKCSDCFLLNEAERFWISTLNTFAPNGYNMNGGGAGMFRITQELREKMSRIKKAGPHSSPEHMKKMSDAIRGKKRPQEVRDKIAAGHRGKPKPSGPNNALYGKVLSDEQKRKISEWTKRGMTPEVIEKITKNRGNFKHSEETKKKMSKTHKAITPRGPDHPWYGKPGTMLGKKRKPEDIRRAMEARSKNRELRRNQDQMGLNFD